MVIEWAEREGYIVDLESEIGPGDVYTAARNGLVPQLYVCAEVHPRGWIRPVEVNAYSYDTHECVKIVGVK